MEAPQQIPLRLVSVQVGPVVSYPAPTPGEGEWHSAIAKHQVSGPVWLDERGVAGDAQADRQHHGGAGQAANVYPSEHYRLWRQTPGLEAMTGGSFGENLTTEGLLETSVCIGDVYRVGQAVVWVSQPRQPCYKLDRRWQVEDLRDRATRLGLTGWYISVGQPGAIQAGDEIELLERPNPDWPIARVWTVYQELSDWTAIRSLAQARGLSEKWRDWLAMKLEKQGKSG
jgi:MOSC domain-containing protein YiiM